MLGLRFLKPLRVVREFISWVGGGGVAEKNALHLARKVGCHFRVVFRDVAVAGVGYQDELALWVCLEDFWRRNFRIERVAETSLEFRGRMSKEPKG
jgi:hypothetical protein